MKNENIETSTGYPSLDKLLGGVNFGDSIVWKSNDIDNYRTFVDRLLRQALREERPIVYFRFSDMRPLLRERDGATVHVLEPGKGFEKFITAVHKTIKATQKQAYLVFDLMSFLSRDHFSERMLGNFFSLTVPLIKKRQHLSYFPLLKSHHSYHTNQPIREVAPIIIDLYRHDGALHVHATKVADRYSRVMHLVHTFRDEEVVPVISSSDTVEILGSQKWAGLSAASYRMIGTWDHFFLRAEETYQAHNRGELSEETLDKTFKNLLPRIFSTDSTILELAHKYFYIEDILHIWKRTIGSGVIGGKAVGMLLARAIIRKHEPYVYESLEPHDSFYIASDIFYLYLVQNNCWNIRQKQKSHETAFGHEEKVRDRIMNGKFPDHLIKRFSDMLDYYGQSPIIVRSSSLLEDNYGNAFAGKYDSVFCINRGRRSERLKAFLNAVKVVYASTMTSLALSYRAKRNILEKDEQMCLLVQRVSGSEHEQFFFPDMAGVGLSFNPYLWDKNIDPTAGVLRLVFGLGTRAVDRSDDDHTRVVALNCPENQPVTGIEDIRKFAQKRVDVLDLAKNEFASEYFVDIIRKCPKIPVQLFANLDSEIMRRSGNRPGMLKPWLLDFKRSFSTTSFISDLRTILRTLREAYGAEVEVEFTANYSSSRGFRVNLVQCRPFQVEVDPKFAASFPTPEDKTIVVEAHGSILGQSRKHNIDRIIYVVPATYSKLSDQDRYMVANLIGQLNHLADEKKVDNTMLIGPGRWGTSTPSLGVPISPTEIESVTVMCEMDVMHEGLTPDLSLGTHFFHELVESNILYIGYFQHDERNKLNKDFLEQSPNNLLEIMPGKEEWAHVVRVIDASTVGDMYVSSDLLGQTATLFT